MELAAILQGEAGVCGVDAMLAIAWLIARGAGPWYGRAEPGPNAIAVARWWWLLPDPLAGAGQFMFSDADLRLDSVQTIIRGRRLVRRFECAGGLGLNVY